MRGSLLLHVCREQPLRRRSVPLPVCVLLVRVRHRDGPVAQELTVHRLDRRIGRLERVIGHEPEPSAVPRVGVPHDLGRLDHDAKRAEGIVQELLVQLRIQIADEEVGADVVRLLIDGSLVRADRLTEQLDHVQHLDGVVRVIFSPVLHEGVTLMRVAHAILRHVHVHHRSRLDKRLPQHLLGNLCEGAGRIGQQGTGRRRDRSRGFLKSGARFRVQIGDAPEDLGCPRTPSPPGCDRRRAGPAG